MPDVPKAHTYRFEIFAHPGGWRTFEVSHTSMLGALEHLKECGWIRWDDVEQMKVNQMATARQVG